ncbi:hypothetical protein ACWCOW_38025 [Streptomyces sp. NPDC001939]
MAHTFDQLVERQQAANAAYRKVLRLRDEYGPPTIEPGVDTLTQAYETAWRAWRDLARDTQAAVTEYAKEQGLARYQVEAEVKARAGESAPES